MTERPDEEEDLNTLTRKGRFLGYGVLLAFVVGFGGWAAVSQLSSAALAPGVVSPDGARKTVQHYEGGIVNRIHVKQGDKVKPGDVLVTLADTRARSDYSESYERFVYLAAHAARLEAEAAGAKEIVFPQAILTDEPVTVKARAAQESLFRSRREALASRENILGSRKQQLAEEITGLRETIAAQRQELGFIEKEIGSTQTLYDKGLAPLPRLLALQRAKAEIDGEIATNKASIARRQNEIGETDIQIVTSRADFRKEVDEELSRVRTALSEVQSRLPSREDALTRTTITAPIAGTVMNVRVNTESGGVVRPGEPIVDIVPEGTDPIIDARVSPLDIDNVHPGMLAKVVLPAYRQRNLPIIHGELTSISADRLVDEKTGESYFLAKVKVNQEDLVDNPEVQLMAGMPAEVMLVTGERSFLDYLLKPFSDSILKAFREN